MHVGNVLSILPRAYKEGGMQLTITLCTHQISYQRQDTINRIQQWQSQAFRPRRKSKNSNSMKFVESENSLSCMPSSLCKPLIPPRQTVDCICDYTLIVQVNAGSTIKMVFMNGAYILRDKHGRDMDTLLKGEMFVP